MIVLSIQNEKREFNVFVQNLAEAEVQRHSPIGSFLLLRRKRLVVDKNCRIVSLKRADRWLLLSLPYVCPGQNRSRKVRLRKLLTYRLFCPRRARFRKDSRGGAGSADVGARCTRRRQAQLAPGSEMANQKAGWMALPWGLGSRLLLPFHLRIRGPCDARTPNENSPRLPRGRAMREALCPKPQCYRAALRRLPSCRLSRTHRA